ncbi:MAG TPA: FecR domain-containing protein [Vicinamibacterales bacterium]|nr:FecR domain-containing protein [Vicinamibacterales bacterium]
MTNQRDDKTIAYLWDPHAGAGGVDPALLALEKELATLSFDAAERPLPLPARSRSTARHAIRWWSLAAAAVVLIAASGVWFSQWRWTWPAGRPWVVSSRPSAAPAEFAVGAPFVLPGNESAVVNVARIGTMRVDGGSQLALRSTQGTRHRLAMEYGRISLRVWAPPGSVAIQTPAGEVIDLGCEFDLDVDATSARVSVRSGWVQLDNGIAESLIPAGASSGMTRNRAPGVPVFDTAVPQFRDAVRRYEATLDVAYVDAIVTHARVGDVLTLVTLIARGGPGTDRLGSRGAELWPLPDGVTVGGILRGDRDGLWRWRDTLELPPVKGWLRNWRDALPAWLVPRAAVPPADRRR